MRYDSGMKSALVDGQIQGFKVNIKHEKKSKFSSVVLKLRGIDQVVPLIVLNALSVCFHIFLVVETFISFSTRIKKVANLTMYS